MGVGALSNWVGLTQNANDGMNLLQRIIWLVLSWDASEFRKVSEAIERAKGGPVASKEQLATIRSYVSSPREEHDEARRISAQEARPMVAVILERSSPDLSASVSEAQLVECSQYLSALLSARDRDEISNALCRQNPDLFTQAIKDAVAAFEPMIRTIHQRVDLREQISAAEGFVNDFLSIHKPKKSASGLPGSSSNGGLQDQQAPSVEDYVLLLRNNRQLLYNWLHQLASQCPELRDDFCAWAKKTIKEFRQAQYPPPKPADAITPNNQKPELPPDTKQRPGAAGALSADLQDLFASLAPETRAGILPAIDAHAAYLSALEDLSLARMQRILDNLATNTTTNGATAPSPNATTSTTTAGAAAQAGQTAQTAPPSFFSPAYWSGRSTPRSPTPSPDAVPPANTHNKAGGRSVSGPGMYLSRWQHLLDSTAITPAYPGGAVRRGRDVKGQVARGKVAAAGVAGAGTAAGQRGWDAALLARMGQQQEEEAGAAPPDVRCVVEALGERFRDLVGGI
ncbi:76b656e1-9aad-4699-879b-1b5bdf2ce4bb [Thermothielavioides terrestris]|uniref:76b656e1-9aad-4699-879b-1b5bdf2ce4bb n=1 Tax=Thermothielavioides terrestris TaxID=2587410 RepID=A0A446BW07_9PEZI|nr:76b656e1-9aad-4699-879b-1b5bdf2ce4bb [Thermothielavioides terrestris]